MMTENRNSGAIIFDEVIVKVGGGAGEQADFMNTHSEAFCRVLKYGLDYCIMPRLQKFDMSTPTSIVSDAFRKLSLLWTTDCGDIDHSAVQQRSAYHEYVKKVTPDDLTEVINLYYNVVKDFRGTPVYNIHGDATLQNIVWCPVDDEAFWIDPNQRSCVPREKAVDVGKLLQSLEGYDRYGLSQIEPITNYIEELPHEELLLSRYYLVTHLARLWRYQDNTVQQWAFNVAERYRGWL